MIRRPSILALDLEGTLISNAASQIPRPGLLQFLERCRTLFPRIVMFTTISDSRFRAIADLLVAEDVAPAWFAQLECVAWTGQTKNLEMVDDAKVHQCLLVDDFEGYVHPGQNAQWISIESFAHPYDASDVELTSTLQAIEERLSI